MDSELTDRDRLTDMLLLTKAVAGSYHSAALEAATPKIRTSMTGLHQDELEHAELLFSAMEERGWYRPEPASPPK